jgi:hypothetical protein
VRAGYGRPGLLNGLCGGGAGRAMSRISPPVGGGPVPPLPCAPTGASGATPPRASASRSYSALPGAEYGPAKRWPYFSELAARSARRRLCSARQAIARARGHPGTNLVGRTTLDEAIDLMRAPSGGQQRFGPDARRAATGRADGGAVRLLQPERTPPLSPKARVLWLKVECSPALRACARSGTSSA